MILHFNQSFFFINRENTLFNNFGWEYIFSMKGREVWETQSRQIDQWNIKECSQMDQLNRKFRKYLFQIGGRKIDKSTKDIDKFN